MAKCLIWEYGTPKLLETALEASITSDMRRRQFLAIDREWTSFKDNYCPKPPAPRPDNHTWRWYQKVEEAERNSEQQRTLALVFKDKIEGLVMLSLNPREGRGPDCKGHSVLYIEYLETAPWNQVAYGQPLYSAVGTALLAASTEVSKEIGCEGRLALHSLKSAEDFYKTNRFKDLGKDEKYDLDYFERIV